jgi:FkbM family methyltransferase
LWHRPSRRRRRTLVVIRLLRRDFRRSHVWPTLARARHVSPAWRFVVDELRKVPRVGTYRVPGLDGRVCLRHHGIDAFLLDEFLVDRLYDPPAEVAVQLGRVSRPLEVLDLGANIGFFGLFARTRYPGARVTAFEPDPANAEVHRGCQAANRADASWTLIERAVAERDGSLTFAAEGSPLSHVVPDGRRAIAVPAEDILPRLAGADLVKMDIEGGEWPILTDPRFAALGPGVLVVEYHDAASPGPDARAEAVGLLERAGYAVRPGPQRRDEGTGILWAWRHLEDAPCQRVAPLRNASSGGRPEAGARRPSGGT